MKNDARDSVRKDETELPGDVLMAYKVASDHPRAIYIDKLGVRARALFAYVETLTKGDQVVVERGDGTKLAYAVAGKEEYNYKNVNMAEVMRGACTVRVMRG